MAVTRQDPGGGAEWQLLAAGAPDALVSADLGAVESRWVQPGQLARFVLSLRLPPPAWAVNWVNDLVQKAGGQVTIHADRNDLAFTWTNRSILAPLIVIAILGVTGLAALIVSWSFFRDVRRTFVGEPGEAGEPGIPALVPAIGGAGLLVVLGLVAYSLAKR